MQGLKAWASETVHLGSNPSSVPSWLYYDLGQISKCHGAFVSRGVSRSRWHTQSRIMGGGYSQRDSFLWAENREPQWLVQKPRAVNSWASNHPRLERMRRGSLEEETPESSSVLRPGDTHSQGHLAGREPREQVHNPTLSIPPFSSLAKHHPKP